MSKRGRGRSQSRNERKEKNIILREEERIDVEVELPEFEDDFDYQVILNDSFLSDMKGELDEIQMELGDTRSSAYDDDYLGKTEVLVNILEKLCPILEKMVDHIDLTEREVYGVKDE